MKFKDLPIGTKFLDDTELLFDDLEELIKVSDTQWDYPSVLQYNKPLIWPKEYEDREVYPVLEWLYEV